MIWKWARNRTGDGKAALFEAKLSDVQWLNSAEHPWGVPILDLRPVTLTLMSTAGNPQYAANAISFLGDAGTGFVGSEPAVKRTVNVELEFRTQGMLADGVLFCPQSMEHKWAIFYHANQIIFVRSWKREVFAVADTKPLQGALKITTLRGAFMSPDEDLAYSVKVLDYLLRSHVLKMECPVPLPRQAPSIPKQIAVWCFQWFGNLAHFATSHSLTLPVPEQPMRSNSLLHMAAARGDFQQIQLLLNAGVPIDLLSCDGQAPLNWALAGTGQVAAKFLLDQGASVDVRFG